jgi:hypothetical protein
MGSSLTVHAHCKQLASVAAGARLFLDKMGMTCNRSEGTRARTHHWPRCLAPSLQVRLRWQPRKVRCSYLQACLPSCLPALSLSPRFSSSRGLSSSCFIAHLCVFESFLPHFSIHLLSEENAHRPPAADPALLSSEVTF